MSIREQMKLFYDNPVVSWHEHIHSVNDCYEKMNVYEADKTVEIMELLGIDKATVSLPVCEIRKCLPEVFISANNIICEAVKRYPDKFYGVAYVHPGYIKEALYEIDRCVNDLGFVGIKVYHDYFMDDPVYSPIIEKCIELDIPILQHSARCMDPANKVRQPLCSDGTHMANAARRYPEATFIMGHFTICEWEWSLKAIADCPNVYTDMSGSSYDCPQMEKAVKLLGAERILFATDGSWDASVGKLLGADISEEDKKTILRGRAFERFLERKGR